MWVASGGDQGILSRIQGLGGLDPVNQMPREPNQQPVPGQKKPLPRDRVPSSIPKGGTETAWLYPSPQMFYNGAQLFPESQRGWFMTRLSEEELLVQGPSVFSPVVAQQQPLWNSHCMPHLGAARPGMFVVAAWQRRHCIGHWWQCRNPEWHTLAPKPRCW